MLEHWQITVGDDLAALDKVADSARYAFQSAAWLGAWSRTLGVATRPVIVTVADTRPRMVLALGLSRYRGLRVVEPLGGGVTDYHAPVVEPDFALSLSDDEAAAIWAAIRRALPPHDLLRWPRMPTTLPGGLPNPLARLTQAREAGSASMLRLPPPGGPLSLSARLTKRLRQHRRQLARIAPVVLEVLAKPTESAAAVDDLMRLKSARWRATGAVDAAINPRFVAFYQQVVRGPWKHGRPHLSRLRCGEDTLALHLGLVDDERLYVLMFGWSGARWHQYSPGLLMLQSLAIWASDHGLALLDLTVGEEAYKRGWTDMRLPLVALEEGATRRGRMMLRAAALVGLARARLKRVGWLRAFVRYAAKRARGATS